MIVELAHRWKFPEVKELALRELQKIDIPIIDRIILYQRYKVGDDLLVPLYTALCSRDEPPSHADLVRLGVETTALILLARERVRARPSDGGRSPLPPDIEPTSIFTTIRELSKSLTSSLGSQNRASSGGDSPFIALLSD